MRKERKYAKWGGNIICCRIAQASFRIDDTKLYFDWSRRLLSCDWLRASKRSIILKTSLSCECRFGLMEKSKICNHKNDAVLSKIAHQFVSYEQTQSKPSFLFLNLEAWVDDPHFWELCLNFEVSTYYEIKADICYINIISMLKRHQHLKLYPTSVTNFVSHQHPLKIDFIKITNIS